MEMDHRASFAEVLVVRDDNCKLQLNSSSTPAWGAAVLAYSKIPPVNRSLVRLSSPHIPG